jgi:hypothetical protein
LKRLAFLLIGLIVSVVSLYYALQGFDLGGVWDAVGRMQIGFFALLIVPYIVTFMTKVWRWRSLFHPDEYRAPVGLLFSALMISYIPLPFRAGEVARGMIVSARSGLPPARVFSTILVEKVLDVLTLLLLLGVSLPFIELPEGLQGTATLLGAVFLVVTIGLLVLVLRPGLARSLVHMAARFLPARLGPRIEEATNHALQGLAPLSNPPVALRLGLWSVATWSVNAVTVYLMLLAFNIAVSPMAAVALVVVTNLSMAVPSAPGYVGPFEAAVVTVLDVLGVAREAAQSFALLYHFIGLVPVATIGVIMALQQGVGLAAFRGSPDVEESPAEAAPVPPVRGVKSPSQAGMRDKG